MSKNLFKLLSGSLLILALSLVMPANAYGQNKKGGDTKAATSKTIKTVDLEVTGMTCQKGCANGIDRKFKKTKGVVKSETTQATGTSSITYDESKISVEELIESINSRGFTAEVAKKKK